MNGSIVVVGGASYTGSAQSVIGRPMHAQIQERGPGDSTVLVTVSQKTRRELGWASCFENLGIIVKHACL